MRVAFDFTSGAWQAAGIGRATRGLIAEILKLDDDLDLRPFYSGLRRSPLADGTFASTRHRPRRLPLPERAVLALWHKLRIPVPIELVTGRVDLVHSPDFVLPPSICRRSVVTVHDLTYVTHPDTAHPAQKRYLGRVVPRSVNRATRIIAVSTATRDDLVREYGVEADRIDIIYNGLDQLFARRPTDLQRQEVRRKFELPDRFALAVGTIQPRKNLVRMAEAVSVVRRRGEDIHFVHAGARGWLSEGVLAGLSELPGGFVRLLGPVDDRWLPALYAEAEMTMAASVAEGFMLPIIESMSMGTPVITANVSCMPEVAGEAAMLVDPRDPEAIADAVWRIATDQGLVEGLVHAGERRAADFGWPAAAAATLSVYRHALEV